MNRNIETRKLRFETEQDKEIFLQVMSKSNWGAEYEGVEEIYPYDVRFNLETSRPSKKSLLERQTEATEKIAEVAAGPGIDFTVLNGECKAGVSLENDYCTKEEVREEIRAEITFALANALGPKVATEYSNSATSRDKIL